MCARKPTSTAASPAFSARSPKLISSAGATSPTRWPRSPPRTTRTASATHTRSCARISGFAFCREESEKNPLVAGPLKRTDCSLVSDGAAALVLADVDTALQARQGDRVPRRRARAGLPADVASATCSSSRAAREAWKRALAEAGVTLADLSFVETHDCFTIAELIEYEAMGLVPEGQGARAITDGWTAPKDGVLPINPSGGLKAKGHPIGATGVSMHALAAMQLTGSAGDMQVKNAQARRHVQHGRRGGRQLCEHPGASALSGCAARAGQRARQSVSVSAPAPRAPACARSASRAGRDPSRTGRAEGPRERGRAAA